MQYKGAALPTLDIPPDAGTLKKISDMALVDMNALVEGKGNMKNWMGLSYRLHVGMFALQEYYDHDQDTEDFLYRGIVAMRCMNIRMHLTGEVGFLMWEFDAVIMALGVTDQLMRTLRLSESVALHHLVDQYYTDLTEENKRSYPGAQERAAVVAMLEAEREMVEQLEKAA